MKILDIKTHSTGEIIKCTSEVLTKGGLVLFPTETTYGAGVDATNKKAVAKLLSYKSKRQGKPLSIAVNNKSMAKKYVEWNEQADILYDKFLPGPVTIVCNGKQKLVHGVESEFGTVGIRVPDYPMVLELLKHYKKPITATSANASGKKRPYAIKDVLDHLSEKQKKLIDLVIDAGELPHNEPSTVIDTTLSTPLTVRARKSTAVLPEEKGQSIQLLSRSEMETKDIAGRLVLKQWNAVENTGLVIGLDGKLGMGKTIFSKGVANFLHIKETITSPTYSYIEEYPYLRHEATGMFYHLDMWKVDTSAEFQRLEIERLIKPNAVIVIEWFNQVKDHLMPLLLQENVPLLLIEFDQKGQTRKLIISEVHS